MVTTELSKCTTLICLWWKKSFFDNKKFITNWQIICQFTVVQSSQEACVKPYNHNDRGGSKYSGSYLCGSARDFCWLLVQFSWTFSPQVSIWLVQKKLTWLRGGNAGLHQASCPEMDAAVDGGEGLHQLATRGRLSENHPAGTRTPLHQICLLHPSGHVPCEPSCDCVPGDWGCDYLASFFKDLLIIFSLDHMVLFVDMAWYGMQPKRRCQSHGYGQTLMFCIHLYVQRWLCNLV